MTIPEVLTDLIAPVAAIVAVLAIPVAEFIRVRREVRDHVPSVTDGCCSCGGPVCDVVLNCGENYCWSCIDSWPAGATPLEFLGVNVLPGRERTGGAR